MKKHRFDYFASCPTGLEELLEAEILSLGAKTTQKARGGVSFEAYHEIALQVVLESRIASRVFKPLYSFPVLTEKEFYLELTQIKWKSLLRVDQTFKFHTIFGSLPNEREQFRNSQFLSLKAKDAVVDWFKHYEGQRPSVDKDRPDFSFLIRLEYFDKQYQVTLLWDLAGFPLHQRGYRFESGPAPMKENLAAGIIQLLKWDGREEPFYDPMCGTGTLSIEAAMIKGQIPPSFMYLKKKPWSFLKSDWFQKDEYLKTNFDALVQKLSEKTQHGFEFLSREPVKIHASDRDKIMIETTKYNIQQAGLQKAISVNLIDALQLQRPNQPSLIVYNPPYGERLEPDQEERLIELYYQLGEKWKKEYKGSRIGFFTGHFGLLKKISLRTKQKMILFNGPIECRLAVYEIF